jgi:type IX secretion system PorP/SprF family membrane protein
MKHTLYLSLFLLPLLGFGQQIPLPGVLRTTDYLWNPALAGHPGAWGAHATYNQQWLGFDGAPVTGIVGGHRNFHRDRMALAGDIIYDATGPLTFAGLAIAYKYQINPVIFSDHDRLSFGILGTLGQRRFDGSRSKVSDAVDPLLSGEAASSFDVNAGAGILYRSVPDNRLYKSHFYAGLGASRLVPTRLALDNAPFGNRIHGNAVLGWRHARDLYLDHTMWLNYADGSLYNLAYQFRLENPDAFWAGLNLNSNFTIGLETGLILDGGWLQAEQFRIGALAAYNAGRLGTYQGFSFGIHFEVVKDFR